MKPVDGVVVGGDGLRVAVDHDRLVAFGPQPGHGFDAAGVELDPLADADRSATENDDRAPRRRLLVAVAEAAVEIGRTGLELGGAGVDPPPDAVNTGLRSQALNLRRSSVDKPADLSVGEAKAFDGGNTPGSSRRAAISFSAATSPLMRRRNHGSTAVDCVETLEISSRGAGPRRAPTDGRGSVRRDGCSSSSSPAPATDGGASSESRSTSSERMALSRASSKERPMAATSPTAFIAVPSRGSAPGNFSKVKRGILTTT